MKKGKEKYQNRIFYLIWKSFQKKLKISLTYYGKDDKIYTVIVNCT